MKNLAPYITRQRMLIEGFYDIEVNEQVIEDYFKEVTKRLSLRMYGKPIVFSPTGDGSEENQGYDAFVPLIDSGVSVYVWTNSNFISLIIYTCKAFDEEIALKATIDFWKMEKVEFSSF